jgi:predicted TIM-barrel enzyme/transcriptional regulator with AAA-type ATPase domain
MWGMTQALRSLRQKGGGSLLIGAAIGVGIAAQAAERGGADFLVVLAVGRLRVMGAASTAAMLPIGMDNARTDSFARREILGKVSIPVFLGVGAMDPRLDLDAFARELKEAGYAGVANFPTVIHLDGKLRRALEEAGMGMARETALLAAVRRAGLATMGYIKTWPEAEALLAAGIDMLCVNFGWNAGGTRGVDSGPGLDEATRHARHVIRRVRAVSPQALCVVEGGPIVSPEDMSLVCRQSSADGYVGGSTLDRLPLETAVMQSASAFKTAAIMRGAAETDGRDLFRIGRIAGLVGQSDQFRAAMHSVARLASTRMPVLVTGEPGSGKTAVATALHLLSGRTGPLVTLQAATSGARTIEQRLFGTAGNGDARCGLPRDGTVIIEDIHRLDAGTARRLADWLDAEHFIPPAAETRTRIIGTAPAPVAMLAALAAQFSAGHLALAPLRDRPPDLPVLMQHFLQGAARSTGVAIPSISAAAYRRALLHSWPENARQLKAAMERALAESRSEAIGAEHILLDSAPAFPPIAATSIGLERQIILTALQQHGFRRGKTAAFLGMSRKTLYNKMRLHKLHG